MYKNYLFDNNNNVNKKVYPPSLICSPIKFWTTFLFYFLKLLLCLLNMRYTISINNNCIIHIIFRLLCNILFKLKFEMFGNAFIVTILLILIVVNKIYVIIKENIPM